MDIKRSPAVQILSVLIIIANCASRVFSPSNLLFTISWLGLVTGAFIFITVASLVWHEDVVKEVFVIPVATLFAFTSVRANLPGAPEGFGTLSLPVIASTSGS